MKNIRWILLILGGALVGRSTAQELAPWHPKYQTTLQVCKQVAYTFGDLRPKPKLVMLKGGAGTIARYSPLPEPQLIIDEKLYDLCHDLGRDSLAALAFVIGHELTHFFYNHLHSFGLATATPLQADYVKRLEYESDLQGLIHAFSAGYSSFEVAEHIIEKLYSAYRLPDKLMGYPSKSERLKALKQLSLQAKQLASTFEVGKFLYLKKEYLSAEHCFSFLCSQMPSKEHLNNLGLIQLQRALCGISVIQMPFKLPIEMDANNRLLNDFRRGNEETAEFTESLLESAVGHFEKAIDLDKRYLGAYINLAIARLLLHQNGTAKDILEQIEHQFPDSLPPEIKLLKGITHLRLGEYGMAQAAFTSAEDAFEITYNRQVAQLVLSTTPTEQLSETLQKLCTDATPGKVVPLGIETSIGSVSLPLNLSTNTMYPFSLPKPNLVRYHYNISGALQHYKIQLKDSKFEVLQYKGDQYSSNQGIKRGDSSEKLIRQYGTPTRIVLMAEGYYYCYDKSQIYFLLHLNEVRGWLIFKKIIEG
jgi:hypothetical protein